MAAVKRNRMTHTQAIKMADAIRAFAQSEEHGKLTSQQVAAKLSAAAGISVSIDTMDRMIEDLNLQVNFAKRKTGFPQSGLGWVKAWFTKYDEKFNEMDKTISSMQMEINAIRENLEKLHKDVHG